MKYLTITDFARLAGVSRQTVYNRLDSLTAFVKTDGKVKYLSTSALSMWGKTAPDDVDGVDESILQSNEKTPEDTGFLTRTVQNLFDVIAEKDKQIERLDAQVQNLTGQVKEYARQVEELTGQILQQNDKALALAARGQELQKMLLPPQKAETASWWQRFIHRRRSADVHAQDPDA